MAEPVPVRRPNMVPFVPVIPYERRLMKASGGQMLRALSRAALRVARSASENLVSV
jgi:hypothetical protein